MKRDKKHRYHFEPLRLAGTVLCCLLLMACQSKKVENQGVEVPRGYLSVLEIERGDRLIRFGPFAGYYFSPVRSAENPDHSDSLARLRFLCFNENSFYTRDLPENSLLFEGEALLTRLPDTGMAIPAADRINPVFFADAPEAWLQTRPEPQDAFVHFHSCYDARGPVLTGYWLSHKALAHFTYDMGGRVGPESPLYHNVSPGRDKEFAGIIEFDRGPAHE